MRLLEKDVVIAHYAADSAGQRDYDLEVWFKIDMSEKSPLEIPVQWDSSGLKAWFCNVLAETDAFISTGQPLWQRILHLLGEWVDVRGHIPDQARSLLAEGFFNHINVLQEQMYQGI